MDSNSGDPSEFSTRLIRWRAFRPRQATGGIPNYLVDSDKFASEAERVTLELCDGSRDLARIAEETQTPDESRESAFERTSILIREAIRLGLLESIEEAAFRQVASWRRAQPSPPKVVRFCVGDFFTVVALSDGSQGAAINFHNVSGPHKTAFNHKQFERLVAEVLEGDPVLEDTLLRWTRLDPLAKSLKMALLNAMSSEFVTPEACENRGLKLQDGFLDLAARLRPGDVVAMIGCTGNYSCPEVGKVDSLKRVHFSDFEYTGSFKSGIERCIEQFFVKPSLVDLSDGTRNEEICRAADVVVLIADTMCTNTLDELVGWSANAREILVTGRSYVLDPIHVFERGVTGLTMQRIVVPDIVEFVERKLSRREFGFTESLVECFQRTYVTEAR